MPNANYRVVTPEEWGGGPPASTGNAPAASGANYQSALKAIGQNTAGMAANLAPVVAGAEMGGELGALGGPFDPVTVPVGAVVGAGIGGLASPTAEWLAGKATGKPETAQPPGWAGALPSAISGAESEIGGRLAGEMIPPAWNAVKGAFTGKAEIAQTATEAAAAAEAKNVADRGELEDAAAKERLKQKQATAAAAEKAGQGAFAERVAVADRTQTAKTNITASQQAAQAKLDQTMARARTQIGKEIVPIARTEAIGSTLPSTEAPMEASAERIDRNQQFRDAITAPLQRFRTDWAARRDAVLSPHAAKTIDDAPLRQAVAEELNKWPPGHAPYAPRTARLLEEAGQIRDVPTDEELLSDAGYYDSHQVALRPDQLTGYVGKLRSDWEAAHPVQGFSSVQELLGLQSKANALARASKGADRTAALRVVHGVDDTLASLDIPELKGINAEYRDHRLHFPYDFEDAIQNAARPVDAAKEIFTKPERVLDLVKYGTPEERGQLGQLYADYVKENGDKVLDPATVKALGYTGPFAHPEGWMYATNAVERIGEMFDSAPQAKAAYDAAMATAENQAKDEYATSVLKDAQKDLSVLGPAGKRIQVQIAGARTLPDKATIAVKALSNLEPGHAAAELGAEQAGTVKNAGFAVQHQFDRSARQAAQGFQPQSPEQAAVDAITNFKPSSSTFATRWRHRAEFLIPWAAGSASMGRESGYALAGLGLGVPLMAREGIAWGFRASLRNSAAALEFYHALQNPGTQQGLKTLAKYAVQGIMMQHGAPPPSDNSPVTKPGPAIGAANQKRAENIAGPKATPETIAHVKATDTKIRSGNTPNVQRDLSSGRISLGHVRKMVSGGPANLSSAFEGLSAADSIDVLAKATPKERELFLPVVVQKLQDESKQIGPQQSAMLMNQLRTMMAAPA